MPVTNGYKATKQIHGLDSEYAKRLPIISITLCQQRRPQKKLTIPVLTRL